MRVSLWIQWAISCSACCVAADQYTAPHTVDELHSALANLGLDSIGKLPVPPESSKTSGSSLACSTTCGLLSNTLNGIVSVVGSSAYTQEQSRYWSLQQLNTLPACRVTPKNAADVAVALLLTEYLGCQFAVKSGGHAAFAGASNIQDGVTIDLSSLRQVEVVQSESVTKVGAGNRWLDVYSRLDPMGLSVVGGRVADIGVGGLTLGGGISFFSNRYGWALDGVTNYEIVLANGQIENINQTLNPDLYFALRGGGNNFGIVTRFDLETFPQGLMWGGMTVHPPTTNVSVYKAFEKFTTESSQDPNAALITAYAYVQGAYLFSNNYDYSLSTPFPPIFADFTSISNTTDTTRITTISSLTLELNASNPSGFRQTYSTATFKNSADLQLQILDIFVQEIDPIKNTAAGFLPALVMQPITIPMIRLFRKNGGNALGITEEDGPLTLMNVAIMWSDEADDERIMAAAERIIERARNVAREMGLVSRYIYQNYASRGQDVFGGYGVENLRRLREIRRVYDPDGVFQRLQPGYFKLEGEGDGGGMV
ncbi:MAG: hypothetical protein Q9171_004495 [Xanthocarpia ochracea]